MLRWCRLCWWLDKRRCQQRWQCHVTNRLYNHVCQLSDLLAECLAKTETALSTAEDEYIALSQSLRDLIPLMTLMKELYGVFPIQINMPNFICKVHEDNQSCIKMAHSKKFTPRTKHIALKYHHFKSHRKNKQIKVQYCRTEDQKADLLTKPLADELFFELRYSVCGW